MICYGSIVLGRSKAFNKLDLSEVCASCRGIAVDVLGAYRQLCPIDMPVGRR